METTRQVGGSIAGNRLAQAQADMQAAKTINAATCAPIKASRLEMAWRELMSNHDAILSACERIEHVADQLLGPSPPTEAGGYAEGVKMPNEPSAVDRFDMAGRLQREAVNRLHRAIERFSAL